VFDVSNLIYGIVYTKFDDNLGPQPYFWTPSDISEDLRLHTCVKSISLLAGEENSIPSSLAIIPFPSFNLKGMVKYIEWEDNRVRGGMALAAIILLFNEIDDIIFYKYIGDFEHIFGDIANDINKLARLEEAKKSIGIEIKRLCVRVQDALKILRDQELSIIDSIEFPEEAAVPQDEFVYKIIVCGDPAVGKTSTVLRFTDNAFKRTYLPTIGVNVTKKSIKTETKKIQYIIWDIAGQTKFSAFRQAFYEGADVFILVFDLTNIKSFQSISKWYQDIKKHLENKPKLLGVLLGNKNDLSAEREVSKDEALELARELNLEYLETSALSGENIIEAFDKIGKSL
jgi:small GTP-binding protein